MEKKDSGRVLEIDFFRFVFSVVIAFFHTEYLLGKSVLFPGGAFCVEFFFLVSGYLMMASLEKIRGRKIENLGLETARFLGKKAAAIYPEFALAFLIGLVVQSVFCALPWEKIGQLAMSSSFELLLLQRTGIGENGVDGVIWYVQSMLLCMALLYPLIRKYPEVMRWIVLPLTALLLLGYIYRNFTHVRAPSKWLGLTYKGNLRAMAELSLGAECYFVTQYLRRFTLKKTAAILLTILKWFCWVLVCIYMWEREWKQDMFMLALMCVAVVLAFSRQCVDERLFQNKTVAFLGKLSLPLYLCHIFYAKYLPEVLPEEMRYRYRLVCYTVCWVLTSLLVMYLAGVIRKNLPSLKAAMQRCFLVQ